MCEVAGENWCLFSIGECPEASEGFKDIVKQASAEVPRKVVGDFPEMEVESFDPLANVVGEWYFSNTKEEFELSAIGKAWREFIREPVIPYEVKERREKLSHAYEELARFVRMHEREKLEAIG